MIVDLKEGSGTISLIRLCEKFAILILSITTLWYSIVRCFMLVDGQSVQVWNYEGKVECTIRVPQLSGSEPFTEQTAAIANDLVCLFMLDIRIRLIKQKYVKIVLRDRSQPSRIVSCIGEGKRDKKRFTWCYTYRSIDE